MFVIRILATGLCVIEKVLCQPFFRNGIAVLYPRTILVVLGKLRPTTCGSKMSCKCPSVFRRQVNLTCYRACSTLSAVHEDVACYVMGRRL